MLPKDFADKLKLEFIKENNWLLVLGGQTVGNDYSGNTNHHNRIFEVITDEREIIRIIVHDPRQNLQRAANKNEQLLGTKITIEYLKINFRDNKHPNQSFYQETIFKQIFSGDLSQKDNPEEPDFSSLISLLDKRNSFV